MPDTDLAGRTVLVIGAAGALGAGLVTAFTEAGAAVIGVDQALPATARQLAGVSYRAVNVLDDAALAALFDQGPPPWAVVNTVGGFAAHLPLPELDPAELTSQLQLNLSARRW
jgi:NAD(P)-dependent dehydrogenase (short-subunit alcohol dehydrogenase family)